MVSEPGRGTELRAFLPVSEAAVPERLRVVIAEDNYLVREGTRRLLEDSGEVEVLASVSNAEELLRLSTICALTPC